MENRIKVMVENIKVKGKIQEKGEERELVTEVTFITRGMPGQFDNILIALRNDAPVEVSFYTPQLSMA